MDFSAINWLAVVVSVVASIIIGSIWYHPAVFFKPWLATLGRKYEDRPQGGGESMVGLYAFTIVASAVEATALALVLNTLGVKGAGAGVAAGFMIWLGFVAPTNLVNKLFSGQGWKGWLIEAGEHLVYLLVAGAIIGAWH
ncbi:MAG TPA: DUF1761 domain-containing protein [Anaerolineales bacterium]|nr:DUF1761 domain-containing protein [Anaerolineales bacterium]